MTDIALFDPQRTYDTTAREYDETSRRFWAFSCRRTVDLVAPRPGERVLDLACGPGPVALLEAARVGPSGSVVGLDVSPEMLELARQHATERGLGNLRLQRGDMHELPFAPGSFDVVTCVFGIFFARDAVPVLSSLWSLLAPGGRLGVTTLGPDFFAPLFAVFLDAVADARPDLDLPVPWSRTEEPATFRAMLQEAGVEDPAVLHEDAELTLTNAADWWRIARATGIRRWLLELGEDAAARVRSSNEAWMRERDVTSLRLGVNYGVATRPAGGGA